MTINFPKTLPYPTVQGYAIKPGEAIVRTEMEAGPARQRRRYTQTPSRTYLRHGTNIMPKKAANGFILRFWAELA